MQTPMLKSRLKKIADSLFGPYRLNRIYTLDLATFKPPPLDHLALKRITDPNLLRGSDNLAIRSRSWAAGENAFGFGLWEGETLASMCWFWNHKRFKDTNIWSLKEDEAIMVELVTLEDFRGRGFSPAVTSFASAELQRLGFRRLYTWVWHSNYPSIKSFEKAGWQYIAFVSEMHLPGLKQPLRFVRNRSLKA